MICVLILLVTISLGLSQNLDDRPRSTNETGFVLIYEAHPPFLDVPASGNPWRKAPKVENSDFIIRPSAGGATDVIVRAPSQKPVLSTTTSGSVLPPSTAWNTARIEHERVPEETSATHKFLVNLITAYAPEGQTSSVPSSIIPTPPAFSPDSSKRSTIEASFMLTDILGEQKSPPTPSGATEPQTIDILLPTTPAAFGWPFGPQIAPPTHAQLMVAGGANVNIVSSTFSSAPKATQWPFPAENNPIDNAAPAVDLSSLLLQRRVQQFSPISSTFGSPSNSDLNSFIAQSAAKAVLGEQSNLDG